MSHSARALSPRRWERNLLLHLERGLCALAFFLCGVQGACLWDPDLSADGYTTCEHQEECAPGRTCELGLCVPPAWHDERFGSRQLFIVHNPAEQVLPAGTPVAIRVGKNGIIPSNDFGVDARFVHFDPASSEWQILRSYRDVFDDFLDVFIPIPEAIPASEERALAWLETRTETGTSNYLEDPESVFSYFDDFVGNELSSIRYRNFGTGTPTVEQSKVRVSDNQRLVGQIPFSQPFSLQATTRINGVNCTRFFIGVSASDSLSYGAPSAGFFSNDALELLPEVAPTEESVPRPVGAAFEVSTAEQRIRIDIGEGHVRFWVGDQVIAEPDLRPPFENKPLYLRVEVDGNCSVEMERIHVRELPFTAPVVRAEARVDYQILR